MSYKRLIYLIIFLLFGLAIVFLPGKIIKINNINCVSQYGPCGEELTSQFSNLTGKDLSFALKGTRKVLSSTLAVRDYSIQFKLPNTIRIDLVLRKAKFALNKIDTQDFALVDKDGTILEIQNSTNLPNLKITDEVPKTGQVVNERLLFALDITYDMYAFYQVRSATINGDGLVVEIRREPTVIFPLEGDKNALLGGLALIISRLNKISENSKIEGISEIDLRFKNPVVR